MIRNSTQQWEVGQTVKVGFLSLVVRARESLPARPTKRRKPGSRPLRQCVPARRWNVARLCLQASPSPVRRPTNALAN